MPLDLYGEENRVVDYLTHIGLDEVKAKIYTAVLCRQYRAPQKELISVLRYHLPGSKRKPASSEKQISTAIQHLISLRLFRAVRCRKEEIIEAYSPWEEAIKTAFPKVKRIDPAVASIVEDSLRHFADYSPRERMLIERLGWASWEKPRQSFRDAVSEARHLIRLGVYSSITVYDEIKDQVLRALVEHSQMEVQILMFSPKLAARIENNPDLARDVELRTKDWQKLYEQAKAEARKRRHKPKLEIRYINDEAYSAFHRVGLIDSRKWIFNVHRPGIERGVEGMVYQGTCEERRPSNIFNVLDHYWRDAWKDAVPVAPLPRFARWVRDNRHFLILPVLAVFGWLLLTNHGNWFAIKNELMGSALIGLAISEIYNHGAEMLNRILELIKQLIEALQRPVSARSK